MATLLEALNLYPESRFWRVKQSQSVSNIPGGVATLLVIVVMTVFTITQLVLVFQKQSIRVSHLEELINTNQLLEVQNTNSLNKPIIQSVISIQLC